MVDTPAARLKQARDALGLTQAEVAAAAGVSQGTIGNIESGTRQPGASARRIARAIRAELDWFLDGVGRQPEWAQPPRVGEELAPYLVAKPIDLDGNPDYPAIRRVLFKLSAGASGFGVEYLQDQDAPIVFRRAWFSSRGLDPAKLFAVRVAGDSMQPGLFDGDTVVVNTAQAELRDGQAVAANYEGELVIKRLVRDDGAWWLASDNQDQRRYPRKRCHDDAHIIGWIVHKQSEHV